MKLDQTLSFLESKESTQLLLKEAQSYCMSRILTAEKISPKKLDIELLNKFYNKLNDNLKSKNALMSTKTSELFSSYVSKLIKSHLKEKSEYLKNVHDTIGSEIQNIEEAINYYDKEENKNAGQQWALFEYYDFTKEPKDILFDDLEGLCYEFEEEIHLNDKTSLLHGGYLRTSWYVLEDLTKNAGILWHEIGHQYDYFSSLNQGSKESLENMEKINSCQNYLHTTMTIQGMHPTFQYIGEDFADLFGAYYANSDGHNLGCKLLTKDESGEYDLSLKNLDEEDNHSSALFRALHWHIVSGKKLPDSCSQLLKQNYYSYLKSCI